MANQLQPQCCCITAPTIDFDCLGACNPSIGSSLTVAFPAFNAAPAGGACCSGLDTTYELPWTGDTDPVTGFCIWFLSFPHPCIAAAPLHADSVIEITATLQLSGGNTQLAIVIDERYDLDTGALVLGQRYGHYWLIDFGAGPIDCYDVIQALSVAYGGVDAGATFPYCLDGYYPFGPPGDAVATMNP